MATKWIIDPTHSEVNFKVKHLVISTVSGTFTNFEGTLESSSETDFSDAQVEFSTDVDSISTKQEQRDEHLKSADFFDAGAHPKISFKSTSVSKKGDEEYILNGDLTIKGITKPVSLDVEFGGAVSDPYGNFKAGFEVTGKISRKEFGLTWNPVTEAGSVVVGDDIKLQASVQFVKQ